MLVALIAALQIASTGPVQMQCSIETAPFAPCVVIAQQSPGIRTVGLAFAQDAQLYMGGRIIDDKSFHVDMIRINGSDYASSGKCTQTYQLLSCNVTVNGVNMTARIRP